MTKINTDKVVFIAETTRSFKDYINTTPYTTTKNNEIAISSLMFEIFEVPLRKTKKEYVKIKIHNESLYSQETILKALNEVYNLYSKKGLNLTLKYYDIAIDIPNETYNPIKMKNKKLYTSNFNNTTSYFIKPVNNKNPDVAVYLYDKEKEIIEKSNKFYQNTKGYKELNRIELRIKKPNKHNSLYKLLDELCKLMILDPLSYLNNITEINKQIVCLFPDYFIFTDQLYKAFGDDFTNIIEKHKLQPKKEILWKYKDVEIIKALKEKESSERQMRRIKYKKFLPLKVLIDECVKNITTIDYIKCNLNGYLEYQKGKFITMNYTLHDLEIYKHPNDVRITNETYYNEKISKIIINYMIENIPIVDENSEWLASMVDYFNKYPENGTWYNN